MKNIPPKAKALGSMMSISDLKINNETQIWEENYSIESKSDTGTGKTGKIINDRIDFDYNQFSIYGQYDFHNTSSSDFFKNFIVQ